VASILSEDHFHNEDAAYAYVEARLWPDGPVCPHCGATKEQVGKLAGKTTRTGLYKCYACREQFTVKIGTIFEDSHLPLRMWLQAIHLLCASKKGISTRQLQRMLGVGLKTAWHLGHRVREAMRDGVLAPMGGVGGIVEVDETFVGRKEGFEAKRGYAYHKNVVLTLVERNGRARSFHIEDATKEQIAPIVRANIARESHLMTDEARRYERLGREFAKHDVVDHSRQEYAYRDYQSGMTISTNTVEGYYGVFKRGMVGVYQRCGEQHLHRYLAEFDFRYNHRQKLGFTDAARAERALLGVKGKRLTYETTAQS
jgi:transposase-like protein